MVAAITGCKMKIYISGPMSGLPELNFPAFNEAAAKLRKLGYEVINPAEKPEENNPDMAWADYMRLDIKLLMDCDAVALLPGWINSKGARIEITLAEELGFELRTINGWIK